MTLQFYPSLPAAKHALCRYQGGVGTERGIRLQYYKKWVCVSRQRQICTNRHLISTQVDSINLLHISTTSWPPIGHAEAVSVLSEIKYADVKPLEAAGIAACARQSDLSST